MQYDIIVIGAGLGGLTTAATLAKKGKKVLVLEQHLIAGGAATIFTRKGIRCEVGLHEMDWGLPNKNMKEIIFRKLGILNKIPLIKLPQTWRIKTPSSEYTIPEGRKNVINYLKEQFPDDAKGIDKYFNDLAFTSRNNYALPNDLNPIQFFFYPLTHLPIVLRNLFQQANTGDKLDKYIKSNRLKNILNINIAYYSDDPYEFSWYYHAAAQNEYYHNGVYIKGGSQVLSDQLVDVILKNNGEIRYLSDVTKIELNGNKAVGVSYTNRKTKEHSTVYAKKIVANCSPENIFHGNMLPEKFQEPKTKNLKIACALHTIYIIFKEKPAKLFPNMAYSTFYLKEDELNAPLSRVVSTLRDTKISERPAVFVDYSTIDAGLVPEGDLRGFGVLCGTSRLEEWESLTKDEYKAKKEELAEGAFKKMEELYPGFRENIEYYEVSTPKTVQRYLKTPNGTAYGYRQIGYIFGRKTPRTASQIKNLVFTGAWAFPGGGFTGAIISGYYAAIDILCPMPVRIIWGALLCAISGTIIGSAHAWISFIQFLLQ